MQIKTVGADVDLTDATFVVGVMTDNQAVPGAESTIDAVDPALFELAKFEGKAGQVIALPHDTAKALVLVGLGDEASFESIRSAAGNAVRTVKTERAVTNLGQIPVDGAARAVTEGAALGSYQYRTYKTEGEDLAIVSLELIEGDESEISRALVTAEATNLARDWGNTPALDKAPEALASMIAAAAARAGVAAEIWDQARIEEERLGALLGVAAGSDRPPRVVILDYRPEGATTHLGLVGKGITFDSGGLSIKTAAFMEEM
ncbi:MAG: M17 family peptidase N-terminal domain-containing protein, partial [Acidimicrobiia bacterium]